MLRCRPGTFAVSALGTIPGTAHHFVLRRAREKPVKAS